MSEVTEPKLTEKPSWLELPEEEKQSHTYWGCHGHSISRCEEKSKKLWVTLFHSKEEAECYASLPKDSWEWNKKPATSVLLQDAMFQARVNNSAGVAIFGYKNGEWGTLKKYPANVPLGTQSDD